MPNHTIKVFTVFLPDGTVHLEYIHHQESHPTEDSPGQPLTLPPGEQVRWKSMSGAPIAVHFDTGSPFVSGVTDLPINPPKAMTEWQTVKVDVPTGTGGDPDYKYSVTVDGVPPDDPDLIIDLSGGGGAAKGGRGVKRPPIKKRHKPASKYDTKKKK